MKTIFKTLGALMMVILLTPGKAMAQSDFNDGFTPFNSFNNKWCHVAPSYPTPSCYVEDDMLYIEYDDAENAPLTITVYDNLCRIVAQSSTSPIDISDLQSGLYNVVVNGHLTDFYKKYTD